MKCIYLLIRILVIELLILIEKFDLFKTLEKKKKEFWNFRDLTFPSTQIQCVKNYRQNDRTGGQGLMGYNSFKAWSTFVKNY